MTMCFIGPLHDYMLTKLISEWQWSLTTITPFKPKPVLILLTLHLFLFTRRLFSETEGITTIYTLMHHGLELIMGI